MKKILFLFRLIQISFVVAKYGLDKQIVSLPLFRALRFLVYLNPWHWFRKHKLPNGEALCLALEELGPIFVKFGQALSTRRDLFSKEYTDALSRLQDAVAPFSSDKACKILEAAYGQTPNKVFDEFDKEPFASASIAQVHHAKLNTGENVVVKILRPNISYLIARDLNVMHVFANMLDRYFQTSKRLKPKEIVNEFQNSLYDELDMMREAANASQLKRNFENSPLLYVPEVHWKYCRDNILVTERIKGIPISDIDAIKARGIDLKKLSEVSIEIFFTQLLKHSFFHADMHPGNIFINPDKTNPPQYICVDFGIIGTLTDTDKRYLALNLSAFFNRDYRKVATLHIESGWLPEDTRVVEFESAIRTVCEPIFEKPLKEISFGQLLLRLFQTSRRFNMEVQPQLILLQKTLIAVEGLGRQIYPELDLWQTAKPFIENWIKEQMGPRTFINHLKDNIPFISEQLPFMPKLVFDVLEQQKNINNKHLSNLNQHSKRLQKLFYRIGLGLFSLPIIGLVLSHLINFEKFEILAGSVSALGLLLLVSVKFNH